MSELRRNIQINGQTYHLAVNQYGAGAPKAVTPGKPGVLYMDTENGQLYKCRTADPENGIYGWEKVGAGDSGFSGSWNDLTDKPFVPEKLYYEWDEDTEYTEVVPALEGMTFTQLAKVSDEAPEADFFLGKYISVTGTDENGPLHATILLKTSSFIRYSDDLYVIGGAAASWYVCISDTAEVEGLTVTKGIWCVDGWIDPLYGIILTNMKIIDPAVTIDESVIPESVARISEVEEMIADALGVIENGTY